MFAWEGGTFILLLVGGGLAMLLAIRRENRRREALETFFMSFTHDLKTSLASVQLQAEGLREDVVEPEAREPLERLLHDTVRLQIQLENSLFVAQPDGRLLKERIEVTPAVERLALDFPELNVGIDGEAAVLADARAFDAVVRNLLQNAVLHGHASAVHVRAERPAGPIVRLVFADNGRGISPEAFETLGKPFTRSTGGRGTGVGLFVCRQLVSRMGGTMRFVGPSRAGEGFTVVVDLPGER